jgi:hypothetical protein
VEFVGVCALSVSVFVSWAHASVSGIDVLIPYSFHTLLLDVFVMTSVLSICTASTEEGRTWFSFSFVSSIRALKHWRNFRLYANFDTYNRKWNKLHLVMLACSWGFFASAGIMVLESIGSPTDLDYTSKGPTDALFEDQYVYGFKKQRWTFIATVYFLFSTVSTVGYGDFFPVSTFGQWFTMAIVCIGIGSFSMTVHQLVDVSHRNSLGSGEYTPKPETRHVVVTGPLAGQGFKDLIVEVFHADRAAYSENLHVVVLSSEPKSLRVYQRILARRAYVRLRDKVCLLHGSPMTADDRVRAKMHSADTVLVMPDLFASDFRLEDSETVIRALAVCDAVPFTRTMCVLHQAEHRPLLIAAGMLSSDVLCVDEFKMSLLGKACEVSAGIPALICNLCKALGDVENPEAARWQQEYDRGLGHELYEVPLSDSYSGGNFSDAAVDIMTRSPSKDVYLIGLVDYNDGERVVYMHPGHKYKLRFDSPFAGVFLAPSLESIKQKSSRDGGLLHRVSTRFIPGQEDGTSSVRRPSQIRAELRAAASASQSISDMRPEKLQPDADAPVSPSVSPSHTMSTVKSPANSTLKSPMKDASKRPSIQDTTLNTTIKSTSSSPHKASGGQIVKFRDLKDPEGQMEVMGDAYMRGVTQIGRNLLTRGVDLHIVVRLTNEFERMHKSPGVEKEVKNKDNQQSMQPVPAALEAMMGDDGVMPDAIDMSQFYDGRSALHDSPTMKHLKWLHGIHKQAETTVAPNRRLRQEGGHVLICILGPQVLPGNPLPPGTNLFFGLEHFVRPLRSSKIVNPKIVVLSPAKPLDWYCVVEYGDVYFVEGSPLNLFDLDRAGFRKATSIVITRGTSIKKGVDVHTADAESIFATRLIETNLPKNSLAQVIIELVFDQNYVFVPLGRLALTAPIVPKDVNKSQDESLTQQGSRGQAVGGVLGMMAVKKQQKVASTFKDAAVQMETSEYYRQARFASGQLFTPSIITSFAASSLCNPNLPLLIRALLTANMLLVPVPVEWETRTYGDLFVWCLQQKNILCLGLWRTGKSSATGQQERKESGDSGPVKHNYLFVAPSSVETRVLRSDRLLCLVPSL